MKLFLSSLCLIISLHSFAQKNKWKENYTTSWEKFEGGTRLLVTNNNLLPITFKIDYSTVNLSQNIKNGSLIVIPAQAKDYTVMEMKIVKPGKGWKFKKSDTRVYLGDLTDVEYDNEYVYDLPFAKGTSFKVGQGYNGDISHQGKYAIDFNMPVNTPIHAAREGQVVELVKNNTKNCGKPSCADFNNYIKILHADGTIMQYLHMRRNGVKVKVGDIVEKNQLIGYSGNVGWSTGPHLHIDLYLTDKSNQYQTLQTKFKIQEGAVTNELKKGEVYSKDY
jgi:murein DD-endopeptidase MepM/ murein hydrolase activator NlpD